MVYHNSWELSDRSPFGAVRCGQKVRLRLRGGNEECRLRVFEPESEYMVSPTEVNSEGAVFLLTVMDKPGLCSYCFYTGEGICCSAGHAGQGGESVCGGEAHPWQITVVRDNHTPRWLSEGVGYQIYVDRFCNPLGEGRIRWARTGNLVHASWEDTPFYIRGEGDAILRWDFFGGNLEGVLEKLPLLRERGITVLYLNPIFEAVSNHKYDTADYRNIDPAYGDEDSLRRLCEAAHTAGMKLLLDGVFSHTGYDSRYFNALGRYDTVGAAQSEDSPYASWYRFEHFPDKYDCWWNIPSMPCTEELDPGFLEFLVTGEDSVVRHWMGCGVDGWRLDVADELPDAFLRVLRTTVRQENPEAILLGEVWEDASNKVSYGEQRAYLMGQELDSVTDYPFREGCIDFLLGRIEGDALRRRLFTLCENYPRDIFYSLMNSTGTHDTLRLLTVLGEAPEPGTLTDRQRETYRLSPAMRRKGLERIKLYGLLLFSQPGLPTLYYGDEAGLEGYADPYNRGTYPWNREEPGLPDFFALLAKLRRDIPALRQGDYLPLSPAEGVFGTERRLGDSATLTLVNREDTSVTLPLSPFWKRAEVLLGNAPEKGSLTLPPRQGVLLLRDKR